MEMPKTISRQFPIKSMLMGVVGRPRADKNFNGKILLERVSEEVTIKQRYTNQNFLRDKNINCGLKEGDWKMLHPGGDVTCEYMRNIIGESYALDDAVVDRLVFQFKTFVGKKGNTKVSTIEDGDSLLKHKI